MTALKPEMVRPLVENSLKSLCVDYLDLYLIHSPVGVESDPATGSMKQVNGKVIVQKQMDHVALWREMEKLVDEGKIRAIGVSNFSSDQLEAVAKAARIPIAANQVECNAYFQQRRLRETMCRLGIRMMAYGSLGSPGRKTQIKMKGVPIKDKAWTVHEVMEEPVVLEIAKAHNKKPSQVWDHSIFFRRSATGRPF